MERIQGWPRQAEWTQGSQQGSLSCRRENGSQREGLVYGYTKPSYLFRLNKRLRPH
jgi:hypothetical protein